MKLRLLSISAFSALGFALLTSSAQYDSDEGKAGQTGSPGENTCAQSGCHTGTAVNGGPGSVTITSPDMTDWNYVPGQTYTIQVTVADAGRDLFGLGVEALKSNGDNGGTLVAGSDNHILTKTVQGFVRRNIVHNVNTGASMDAHTFTFEWIAPDVSQGDITFYVAGNATNSNGFATGDRVYTTTQVATASVGIYEYFNEKLALSLSPNPTMGMLQVSYNLENTSDVQTKIFDVNGKLILDWNQGQQVSGKAIHQLDVSSLASGTYMLQVLVNGNILATEAFQKN
jgi:Secretion system C-terminal sorting domain